MNRLYGVTMPEKGISQLVAVDLQKAESMVAYLFSKMNKDPFKTRLEIAKKGFKRKLSNEKQNTSSIGTAFKLSRVSLSCRCRDNYWVYFRQDLWY